MIIQFQDLLQSRQVALHAAQRDAVATKAVLASLKLAIRTPTAIRASHSPERPALTELVGKLEESVDQRQKTDRALSAESEQLAAYVALLEAKLKPQHRGDIRSARDAQKRAEAELADRQNANRVRLVSQSPVTSQLHIRTCEQHPAAALHPQM